MAIKHLRQTQTFHRREQSPVWKPIETFTRHHRNISLTTWYMFTDRTKLKLR